MSEFNIDEIDGWPLFVEAYIVYKILRWKGTCKNNCVVGVSAPEFDKMNDVTKSQARVSAEHDTRLKTTTTASTLCSNFI